MTVDENGGEAAAPKVILVVDDEPSVLRITSRIVHRLGYSTLEASSGEEALRLYGDHAGSIALVVTDVVMGGMDGIQTAEELRQRQGDVPVLFISGHDFGHLVRRHGFPESAAFLQKPFTPSALSGKLREMLNGPE